MNRLLAIILLLTVAGQITAGQEDSCVTLYHHGDRDISLCRTEIPESYTRYDTTSSGISRTPISFETYRRLMEEDTQDELAHYEQVTAAKEAFSEKMRAETEAGKDATNRARSIKNKKDCKAAGFTWEHGTWLVPGFCRAR